MSQSSTTFPKPKDWQNFERITRVIVACVINDPGAQQNGREGQSQYGVDVFGYRDRNPQLVVGVQCKKRINEQITKRELESEVKKALTFEPSLSEFILVTTAPRDQKIQKEARLLTQSISTSIRPIIISVWGWDDIEEFASMYPDIQRALDPTWNSFGEKVYVELLEARDEASVNHDQVFELLKRIDRKISPTDEVQIISEYQENTPLHGEITVYQRFIDDNDVQLAIPKLAKLRESKWSSASSFEKYRLLVAIASAQIKVGNQCDAGQLLLDAYNECPEYEKALSNRATGLLLLGRNDEAFTISKDILAKNPSDKHTAQILVHSLTQQSTCENPLQYIPENIRDSEEVLIAYIQFLRNRGEKKWIDELNNARQHYPECKILKSLFSEAILTKLIDDDYSTLWGGLLDTINESDISQAIEIAYSDALEEIRLRSTLVPAKVHNSVLLLRWNNDMDRAEELIDIAMRICPLDEHLAMQKVLIMVSRNRYKEALSFIPANHDNIEMSMIFVSCLVNLNRLDQALARLEKIDLDNAPNHVIVGFAQEKVNILLKLSKEEQAIEFIDEFTIKHAGNLELCVMQIRTRRLANRIEDANVWFEKVMGLITEKTKAHIRFILSIEALHLNNPSSIITLLRSKISYGRDSEPLQLLVQTTIDNGYYATANDILESLSSNVKEKVFYKRAIAVLAIRTGDDCAEEKIDECLKVTPNEINMILAKITILIKRGKIDVIKAYLSELCLSSITGAPERLIKLASALCYYTNSMDGLAYGYSIIMDNWNNNNAHLAYQGLILINSRNIKLPEKKRIDDDCVVITKSESGVHKYRIGYDAYKFFADEHINPDDDLAKLLIGNTVGNNIQISETVGQKTLEVIEIKSKYIDALHTSMETFNEKFPRAHGFMSFRYNPDSEDPTKDIREVVKSSAENAMNHLKEYTENKMPLAFVAKLIGKDPIDVYSGLPSVGFKLQTCYGIVEERNRAYSLVNNCAGRECVIDAITLSIIIRLGIADIVNEVFGQIYIPQTVFDVFFERVHDLEMHTGSEKGYLTWSNGKFSMIEYSEEYLNELLSARKKELEWIKVNTRIAKIIPNEDFSPDISSVIAQSGDGLFDAAIAASGKKCILLSDDLGFRVMSNQIFHVPSTWIQPVLIYALSKGFVSNDKYYDILNNLVAIGETYISLNSNCLYAQTKKDNFELSDNLNSLVAMIGGPNAAFSNIFVLAQFIRKIWLTPLDSRKKSKITSAAFAGFMNRRGEDLREFIAIVYQHSALYDNDFAKQCYSWLIGHSMGQDYANELVSR